MRKHRTVQILGIVIIAAALVYLILGVIGAISLSGSGLGEGWSSGWRGWLTIPILARHVHGLRGPPGLRRVTLLPGEDRRQPV